MEISKQNGKTRIWMLLGAVFLLALVASMIRVSFNRLSGVALDKACRFEFVDSFS